ncbi:hypothetical protein Tco_0417220 [Tanacetum coccineum]
MGRRGGVNLSSIDLVPQPINSTYSGYGDERVRAVKELHEKVKLKIEKQNHKYAKQANKHRKAAIFKEGDLVWVHMSKERFPPGRHVKLQQRGDGLFKIVQCMGNNAYKVELPGHHRVTTESLLLLLSRIFLRNMAKMRVFGYQFKKVVLVDSVLDIQSFGITGLAVDMSCWKISEFGMHWGLMMYCIEG